jgi:pimeloyl-ACP methyl ester carboxylesterase
MKLLLPALLLLAAAVAVVPARAGTAAAPAPAAATAPAHKGPELPGSEVELKAPDGWTIRGKYQEAADPTKLTLVLLHGRGARKEVFMRLAKALKAEGYGYLALDFRGHGQSVTGPDGQPFPWRKFKATRAENDYANCALDAQAGVQYLESQGVPEERLGLIGDAFGGSIALKYAAVHQKIRLLVMLSPGLAYQDVPIVNAIRAYKDRPIMMVYGELDKTAAAAVPILNAFATRSAGEKNTYLVMVPNTHGTKLLTQPSTIKLITDWLANPVKPEAPVVSTDTAVSTGAAPGEPGPSAQPGEPAPAPAPQDSGE